MMTIEEMKKNLYDDEKALLQVLINHYGYSEEELLIDNAELLNSLKEDFEIKCGEDERKQALKEYYKNIYDDLGLEAFNSDWLENNVFNNEDIIDIKWFNTAQNESNEAYANDIDDERLSEEMEDVGVDTKEDYIEHMNNYYENGLLWHKENFGKSETNMVIKEYNLINEDALIEKLMESEEYSLLAGYDGIEHTIEIFGNTFYIYKNN